MSQVAELNNTEVWVLLSQHVHSSDRPLDDIALRVFEEHGTTGESRTMVLHPHRTADRVSPVLLLHPLSNHTDSISRHLGALFK